MPQSPTSELPVLRKVVRSSTIDLIADQIRNAIYSGSLAPGQSINEVRTAELLVVSRPSLREALQRLVSEGVMSHAPGRGVRVKRMRLGDVDDVYPVREALEAQAVKIVLRTDKPIARIQQSLHRLELAIEDNTARVIGDADLDFHHAIVASSGSDRLSDLMKVSMVQTRLLSLSDRRGYEVRCDLIETHRELAEAIAAGDESKSLEIVGRVMDSAAARLRDTVAESQAVIVRAGDRDGPADDQWSALRDTMKS
ncbi:GntR family transcriptional regulator [Brevibacterium marinum]|uniref:DNA-binding GntR family transcriptional regulator n=1 Tax=Brevibacterium marinum TaxID=418643 RepID=A0A846RS34_9MICO|nr:GntR family transcriptional regulator [Brevibacterium marinum]NJC56864.1 DNA-binding GntR family transcriptional regulator [Brevibacterium marinum]